MSIAGSIIFHHFALWANYEEHSREGYKYETVGENAVNYKVQGNESIYKYIDYDGVGDGDKVVATNDFDKIRE